MKKRIYALLLALCMVMNMTGVAFAEGITCTDTEHDGHTHGEWVIEKPATCTEEGKKVLYCTDEDCGILLHEEVIPMAAHVVEAERCQNDYVEPTCTEDGHDWYHCEACEQLLKKDADGNWVVCDHTDCSCTIPATGHAFVDYPAVEPTCTEDGNNEYRACSVCGTCEEGHEMVVIPATGHGEPVGKPGYVPVCDFDFDDEHSYDNSVPAVCSICGEELEAKIVVAAPHTWEAKEGLDPTCTEWGYTEYRECSVCGRIEGKADIEPLGHDFSKYVGATAGDCTTDASSAGIVCSRCDTPDPENGPEVLPAPGHVAEVVYGYAATCTEDGLTDGEICSVCGEITIEQEVIPALGHAWKTVLGVKATCTTDGEGAHKVCTVCGEKEYADPNVRIIPAHGHSNEDGYYPEDGKNDKPGAVRDYRYDGYNATWITDEEAAKVKAATCTEDGYKANELCSFCNEVVVEGGVIPALGHNWELAKPGVLPTCTEEGISDLWVCDRCDLPMGGEAINARGHDMTTVLASLPTCTEEGNVKYSYCVDCGYAVAEAQEIVEPKLVGTEYNPVLFTLAEGRFIESKMPEEGHPAEFVLAAYGCEYRQVIKALAPTCTENGIEEGATRCLICEKFYDLYLIPALDHPVSGINVVAGQAPDCLNGGWLAYAWCDACDKAVALGESYDIKGIKAALSTSEVVMSEEGHPVEFLLDALGHAPKTGVALAPTCLEPGHTEGIYCERCGLTLEGFEVVDALGHDLVVVAEEIPATCTETGLTAVLGCSRCDYTEGGEFIPATGHNAGAVTPVKPATCTEYGFGEGAHCTKCEIDYAPVYDYLTGNGIISPADLYEAGWVKVPELINPLGHDMSQPLTADPTCTEVGYDNYSECSRCDYTEGAIIPELGHIWIDVPGGEQTAPTCTLAGTDGIHQCYRCKEIEAVTVPALGHDWVKVDAVEATCAADGNIAYEYCSRCDLLRVDGVEYTEYDVVVKDDGLHDNLLHVDAVQATCQTAGHSDGQYCDVCGYYNWTEIEADADAYHAFLSTEEELAKIEWTITNPGDGSVGSGMQAKLCPCCGYILDVKLYPEVQMGDVNMDGRVNSIDALMILQYKAGVIATLPNLVAADVNGDGNINSIDALAILNSKIN